MADTFRAELWEHDGDAAWHFVTLPGALADDVEHRTEHIRRGFGSVRVRVTVGSSTWETSLFPDTSAESYVLPMKKPVRVAEGLEAGDDVEVTIELLDV